MVLLDAEMKYYVIDAACSREADCDNSKIRSSINLEKNTITFNHRNRPRRPVHCKDLTRFLCYSGIPGLFGTCWSRKKSAENVVRLKILSLNLS